MGRGAPKALPLCPSVVRHAAKIGVGCIRQGIPMASTPSAKMLKSPRYRVEWSGTDDVDSASHCDFDDREKCLDEATSLVNRGIPFVWLSELGAYDNKGYSTEYDWVYFWWSGAAQRGNSGELPDHSQGVPRDKSWRYRVRYQRLDDALEVERSRKKRQKPAPVH